MMNSSRSAALSISSEIGRDDGTVADNFPVDIIPTLNYQRDVQRLIEQRDEKWATPLE
jgi:hypothetical protein